MKSIEVTGKTIDEAIEHGLKELNCTRDDVEVVIMEAPSRGLFGLIGAKDAKVKLNLRDKKNEAEFFGFIEKTEIKEVKKNKVEKILPEVMVAKENEQDELPETTAINFLEKVFEKLDLKVNSEVTKQDDFIYISFYGEDLGILIGRRGETLDSLQYLTNLVVGKKFGQKYRIILDVEGYRKRREQTLINLAHRLSEKVKKTGHNIVLEPMNPHERRIIHTALQNDKRVRTFSEGEEPYRKVIITRKSKQ
jgi:spoIIIJ-associated protein